MHAPQKIEQLHLDISPTLYSAAQTIYVYPALPGAGHVVGLTSQIHERINSNAECETVPRQKAATRRHRYAILLRGKILNRQATSESHFGGDIIMEANTILANASSRTTLV